MIGGIGVIVLLEIDNALIVANVSSQYDNVIVGVIMIGALAIDYLRREHLSR